MQSEILNLFPPHIHPLTIVSDPDALLADESILAELVVRGFTLIQKADPVMLRHRIEQVKPFNLAHPTIVISRVALGTLSYDLWQLGSI